MATRSKAWVCGLLLAGIADLNLAGGMDVCCECFVLSGRGLCVRLITRLEESLPSVMYLSLIAKTQ